MPSRILLKEGTAYDEPVAGVVTEDMEGEVQEHGGDTEGEAVRSAIEGVFVGQGAVLSDSLIAVRAWTEQLRERAGLLHGHFILHGAPLDKSAMGAPVGLQLQRRVSELDATGSEGNRGRYRNQSPLLLAQRLVADVLARVEAVRPDDAAQMRTRAAAQAEGASELNSNWTLEEILQDPAKAVVALGLAVPSPHRPNKEPRYGVRTDAYQEAHELFAWRGMQLLDSLARGLPNEVDLRWSFNLNDEREVSGDTPYGVKVVRVWDGKRPLADQTRRSTGPLFWRRFHGDSPVGAVRRIVAKPAQRAAVELLVEAELGKEARNWLPGGQIPLREVLGLTVSENLGSRAHQGLQQAALVPAETLRDEGDRFANEVQQTLGDLVDDPPPHCCPSWSN